MTAITPRTPKSEIYQAYQSAMQELQELRAGKATSKQVRAWALESMAVCYTEIGSLVRDTRAAGALARQWISALVDTYNRPLLKP